MIDLKAYEALKKRNPLAAALLTSQRINRDTEAGLAMIERACDPDELRREYRIKKEFKQDEDQ